MERKIKQAVILSAGLGTRLRPLTDSMPKVMIPIAGKPLLERHIERFKEFGVTDFFVNLHYLPDVITDYFGDGSRLGVRMHYSSEEKLMGTAGGLKLCEDNLDEYFFLIYGDTLSLVDYGKMEEEFFKKPDAAAMQRVGKIGYRSDVDLAELDENMAFTRIYPKPHEHPIENPYSMRGVFIFKKSALSLIPSGMYWEIGKDLFPALLARGDRVYGYECQEYSKGIDTMEKYKEAEDMFSKEYKKSGNG